jgi:hypothetical protein
MVLNDSINEQWIRTDTKGRGHGLIWGTIPASGWAGGAEKSYNKPQSRYAVLEREREREREREKILGFGPLANYADRRLLAT